MASAMLSPTELEKIQLELQSVDGEGECPICLEVFDKIYRKPLCIPCSSGHVVCRQCLVRLFETPAPSSNCFLNGTGCNPDRHHATCPMCKDVFHLPQDNIDKVIVVPCNEQEMEELVQRRRELRKEIIRQVEEVKKTAEQAVEELENLKKEINQHHKNCNIARISGSAPAVVGGIMFITGAALSFFTFGASVPLMISGGALAGAGGAAAGGASVAELVISSKTKNKVQEVNAKCQEQHQLLKDLLQELVIQDALIAIGKEFGYQSVTLLSHISSGVTTILGVVRLCLAAADIGSDVASSAARIAALAGRGFLIAGIVTAAVMLPFDIVSIIWNSYELAKEKPSAFSAQIDKLIDQIKKSFIEEQLLKVDEDLMTEIGTDIDPNVTDYTE